MASSFLGQTSKTYSPQATHVIDGETGIERVVTYEEATSTVYSNLTAVGSATSNPSAAIDSVSSLYLRKINVEEGEGGISTVTEFYSTGDNVNANFGSATWYELDVAMEEAPILENSFYDSISDADLRLLKQLITSGPYAKDDSGNYVAGQVTTTGAPAHALNQIMKGRLTYPRPRAIFRTINENTSFPSTIASVGQSTTPSGAPNAPSGFRWIYIGDTSTRQRGKTKRVQVYELCKIDADLV